MSSKTEIIIDGQNKGAILSINGVKSELKGLASYVGGPFGASLSTLQKHLGLAAIGGAIGGLAALTKQAINSADEIYNMSQRVGVSVEALSTLKYAADLSELSLGQMEIGLKKLSTALYDIAHGQGDKAITVFNELGVEALDANGKVRLTEDVLLDVADKFSKMSDGATKSAMAVNLFGKSGLQVIPFLNQGKEGIKALTDEAEKLGLKMSTEFAQNAEAFNDNLTTMGYTLQGVGISIAEELLPFLFSLSGALKTYATETQVASTAGVGFAEVLKGIATGLGAIYAGATIVGDVFGTIGAALATGDFEQWGNVFSLGFDKIKKDALGFGDAFDALWQDNSGAYAAYLKTLLDGKDVIPVVTNNVKDLYDAFGHPIDKDGNLSNNIKYIETLQKVMSMPGLEDIITNIPTYDMSQYVNIAPDPFDNIRFSAVGFFDMYDERASMMRQNTSDMFGNMSSAASMFYQASGQKAKAWFQVHKAFSIAQGIINTYEGATKALAQGGFFGIAMAAAVIAAGLAQVAMIASQNPSTSGGAGNASSGYSGNTGSGSRDFTSGGGNYNQGQSINYNIIVNGSIVDHSKFAREIVPYFNNAVADGAS